MNIFATSITPAKAAQDLDDLRLNKMIVESAQMLSTAAFLNGIKHVPYRPSYHSHPCTQWVASTRKNYEWLLKYLIVAIDERKYRKGGAPHKTETIVKDLINLKQYIPDGDLEEFADCSNVYIDYLPITERYKMCLVKKWNKDIITPKWTKRNHPHWVFKDHYGVLHIKGDEAIHPSAPAFV